MRWSHIVRDLGVFIHVPAVLCAPTVVVGAAFREWRLLPGLGIAAAVSLGLGQYLVRRRVRGKQTHSLAGSMLTVGAAWLSIGLIAAIPFLCWKWFGGGADPAARPFGDFLTALFESMSGITSTGLSMANDASALPRTIQWWRTLLEWVGGIGVVVLALAIIHPAESGKFLMTAEAREHRIGPSFRETGRRIWGVFIGLTVFSVILFAAAGMPWWEALNHGMTGIATGGFSVTADSFAGYGDGILMAGVLIMLLGAVSFRTYSRMIIDHDWRFVLRDAPTIALLGLFLSGAGTMLLAEHPSRGIGAVLFQAASALGTCGFQTADLHAWHAPVMIILAIEMFIGGTAGSTTGGLKVDRVILVVLGPIWHMRRRLSTRKTARSYTIDGEKLNEPDALRRYRSAVVLASLFIAAILIGTFVLMTSAGPGYAPHEVLFEVTSAMSNVGLSTGITGASLPWPAKLTLIVIMWMGRLEITAVLVFVGLPIILAAENGRPS